MNVRQLAEQQVLILGLGASGLAMARWCASHGAQVMVADTRESPPQLVALQAEHPQVRCVSGAFAADWLVQHNITAVFKSPGLSPEQVAPVFEAAARQGLWLGGELDLFAHALQELQATQSYQPKVLAITGTNGKTTVTSLTGLLIERSGQTVAVAGNIGPTLLDTLAAHLAANTLPQVWVLELSSFQLDRAVGQDALWEPLAATVLNITQDHLDWHGSMQAYAKAKSHVFGSQGIMVLNRDDAQVMAMLAAPIKGKPARRYVSFGSDEPARPGDWGLQTVGGMAWLARALEADETIRLKKGESAPVHIQCLMPADALRIRGRHNATNALAALALAHTTGATLAHMLYGLREYTGEPHRVEPVAIVREVEYFDDSKGTNVGATCAALRGLGADRRIVVILGGDGKGQDFSPLVEPVRQYARAAVLIGRDAAQIEQALQGTGIPLIAAASLEQAVELATGQAQRGDAVLLSPACASLDMFRNYEHRADVFCAAVQHWADACGEVV